MAEELEASTPEASSSSSEETLTTEPIPEKEALTVEAALSLLAGIRPPAILGLLREPDFALISMQAFSGFRVNAQGYANPLVRRRLAQEATRNEKFAERLQTLVAEIPIRTHTDEKLAEPLVHAKPIVPTPQKPSHAEDRAERERQRKEREEARKALAAAEARCAENETARRRAEQDLEALQKASERQSQRIARMERQIGKLQTEQKTLLRLLHHDHSEKESFITPNAVPQDGMENTQAPERIENHWLTAVRHMLDRGRQDAALLLAADVLRIDADDAAALQIASEAHRLRGETRAAQTLITHLFTLQIGRGKILQASDSLMQLLSITARPSDAEREVRHWIHLLKSENSGMLERVRQGMAKLRSANPETYRWLAEQIGALGSPEVIAALTPQPGTLRPNDLLPMDIPGRHARMTAYQLITAIVTCDVDTVDLTRDALAQINKSDPKTYDRVKTSLLQAAGSETSSLTPLLNTARGPVIVDGSNAAWAEQELLVSGRPRMRSILELRRTLWARGFFPVLLYGDAPLPYTIDDPDTLRTMEQRREIHFVNTGVDADEVLLREAKRLHAPLVTNDYMTDWDPDDEVFKIRFSISPTGSVQLLY